MEGKRNGEAELCLFPSLCLQNSYISPACKLQGNESPCYARCGSLIIFMLMPWMLQRFLLIYSSLRRTGACEAHEAELCNCLAASQKARHGGEDVTRNSVAETSRSWLVLDRSWTRTNKFEQRPHAHIPYLNADQILPFQFVFVQGNK